MCHQSETTQKKRGDPINRLSSPEERSCKEAKTQREVVIHKAHLERPAVGDHRDARYQTPRRTARSRRNECKRAPEENQYARRHNNLLSDGESESRAELGQSHV